MVLIGGGGSSDNFLGHGGGSGFIKIFQTVGWSNLGLDINVGEVGESGQDGGSSTLDNSKWKKKNNERKLSVCSESSGSESLYVLKVHC